MVDVHAHTRLERVLGSKARKLEKAFGCRTVGDLLQHYPRTYLRRGEVSDLANLPADEHVTVAARVVGARQRSYTDRRTGRLAYRLEVLVEAEEGQRLELTFFDRSAGTAAWRERQLPVGHWGLFAGKVSRFRDKVQLVHPQLDMMEEDPDEAGEALARERLAKLKGLVPLYPAGGGVQSWDLRRAVEVVLDVVDDLPDPLPEQVRRERGLLPSRKALELLHRPDDWSEVHAARKTLRFTEAFVMQTVLAQRRLRIAESPAVPRPGRAGGILDAFDAQLPFPLTTGQRVVGRQILDDMATAHPMHRLLQGEVGSGKTVVALRAMLRAVDSGGQAALLAPTEVLAQQHHRSITAMMGDLAAGGMLGSDDQATRVALLTGSTGAAARKEALLDAASGAAGIVVGTHALLEERVQFADLGLVVVDEQHRFGVEQRAALAQKAGETPPHVLVMTATPIPRTVAMTVFGDLDTSTLTELPAGRAAVRTSVIPVAEHPGWLARAWDRVREEAEAGRQAYVVCPRIGGEEPDDSELAAVEDIAPALDAGVLSGLHVAALHGRMPPDAKDEVMRQFAVGGIDVLVATTVVEVGVDVANATVMVVLDADRFGVSQLHQLRGRVGRGGLPGLCLLVTRAQEGTQARERLDAVAATTDGFVLSQVDLAQRREGDVLGAAQSGRRSSLRLLSVVDHEDDIVAARQAATGYVAEDPTLSAAPDLAAAVRRLEEDERSEYLEKT